MNENIFREYDIRGVVEADFSEDVVSSIARALATQLRKKNMSSCVVGYDARLSADFLYKIFSSTLKKMGINIINVGMVSSPMLYFAQIDLKTDAAVMITGSHNPSDMNGFKMLTKEGSIYGKEIQDLLKIIKNNQFLEYSTDIGTEETYSIKENYFNFLKENIKFGHRKLKIVVDGGNGTGGDIAVDILKDFGCEVISLYTEPDGRFPNHHPDPTVPSYMQELIEQVKKHQADFGVGYDGDADRIGVVDETGRLLFGDSLMIILAREILERKPGSLIVGEVKCSQNLYSEIEKAGGKGIMWKAGHSIIKAKMKEVGAEMGGEVSGHIFFKDRFFGYDDALYATLRLCEILSSTEQTISQLLSDVPTTCMSPEIRTECEDDTKFRLVDRVAKSFKNEGFNVVDIDGVRVIFEDGFGLLRASNTQPAIVQRYEAKTQKRLNEIQDLILTRLNHEKMGME